MKLIVPVLNRYDLLQRMVSSIDYPIEELLIIDNGDQLVNLNLPDFVESLRILRMPSNQGVAGSWNLGIKSYPFEKVWFFSSADTVYKPGALKELSKADPSCITLANKFPHWHTFAIGEDVVKKIGLFDESIYPIYFEDTDYMWRAHASSVNVRYVDIPTDHDNSSTINSDTKLMAQNQATFKSNGSYLEDKKKAKDLTAGKWDLERRRINNWVM